MVVVVILSILALVIMPRIIDRPDQARVARVQSDLKVLESAVQL
ncbi:MAG: type II secretion system protein GspG, partial [Alphaproteobacteria bacterium HGW-Alphaproteobacteria-2]